MWAKNDYTLLNGQKSKENIFYDIWKLYEIQMSVDKVLLEHSMFIYSHIVYDYFPATSAEFSG